MKTIEILLIDDHTLFRSGLKSLLERESEFTIVGEAADGLEGIKLATKLEPDIILLDLNMPMMNGKETLVQLLNINPELIVLMLTVSEDASDLTECLELGAKGFLLKNIDADFLLTSIHKALEGDNVFSPEMTQKLVDQLINKEMPTPTAEENLIDTLTPREKEILAYLAVGESNKQIARLLDLAESTVKVHVQNILRKLNINSRVQAAVIAVQQGISLETLKQ